MINICLAFDNNFVIPANALIASILHNFKCLDKIKFYILDNGLNCSVKERLQKLQNINDFEINYIIIDDKIFKDFPIPKNGHFKKINYYRILIPELIPNINKILYLDCDIIVDRSIDKLYNIDISNYLLGGVKSVTSYKNSKRLGLPKFTPYINSGVLLINSREWRNSNITSKLIKYIRTSPKENLINVDQDAINAVIFDSIKYIKRNWNVEIRTDIVYPKYYQRFLDNPYILHFVGPDKPWLPNTVQSKSLFNFYLDIINKL